MRTGLASRTARGLAGVCIVLAAASGASAQSIGIRGGINLATEHTEVPEGAAIPIAATRAAVRPVAGFFIGTDDRVPVGVHVELLYDQVGIALKHPEVPVWYTYITIPVLAKIRLSHDGFYRTHLLAGPAFSGLVDAERDLGRGAEDVTGVDKVSVGATVGVLFSMGRLVVDARYTWGLTNLIENAAPGFKTTRRVASLSAGVQFGE
jgi:hypothetical protein